MINAIDALEAKFAEVTERMVHTVSELEQSDARSVMLRGHLGRQQAGKDQQRAAIELLQAHRLEQQNRPVPVGFAE